MCKQLQGSAPPEGTCGEIYCNVTDNQDAGHTQAT